MSTKQKQHQAQDQSKTFHERKRKILPAVAVSLDNADTVIEGGPAFDLLGATGTAGAPLFAIFAKGGRDAACSAGLDAAEDLMVQAVSYPPLRQAQGRLLQKAQERGTHGFVMEKKAGARGRATRPGSKCESTAEAP